MKTTTAASTTTNSLSWRHAGSGLVLLVVAVYVLGATAGGLPLDRPWRLGFGWAAAVVLLATAAYGWRRRAMARGPWRTQTWRRLHLLLGALFLILMLMHTSFRTPASPATITWWLWVLSVWSSVSGVIGWLVHRYVPRLLASGTGIEVVYERIPSLRQSLLAQAEEFSSIAAEPVREFCQAIVLPQLRQPALRLVPGAGPLEGHFERLHPLLPPAEQSQLDRLREIYRSKLDLDLHSGLQAVLRAWLYLHVPPTLIILALLALHLFAIAYY